MRKMGLPREWAGMLFFGLVGVSIFALFGCSAQSYRKGADKEVYGIIAAKQREVFGEERPFSIEHEMPSAPEEVIPSPDSQPSGAPAPEAPVISLADALAIAFVNNRDYQSQEEDVYVQALRLSLERHLFAPIFSGGLSGEAVRTSSDTSGSATADLGVSKLFAAGGRLTVNLTTALSQFFTGDPRRAASSLASMAFVQPLLRGAGRLETQENLTQAERNVVYQLRSFLRFQQSFVVNVVSEYFRVLERTNIVDNEWRNYQDLLETTRRSEMLAAAGRIPEFQVDQARQNELRARNRWVLAVEAYEGALDRFKIRLGVPMGQALQLDSEELVRLAEKGLTQPELSVEEAAALALEKRPDLMNVRGQVEDARRKVSIAERHLQGEASIVLGADISTVGASKPLNFNLDKGGTYSGGLALDLPLERTAERNSYRESLISLERAKRGMTLSADTVQLDVRDAYRGLKQTRESYEIQKRSVELAERRVDSTNLLLQAGRAQTRDLLEAQTALVEARNALTTATVDHTIARLQFFRDVGVLEVQENAPLESLSGEALPSGNERDKENGL